MVSTPLKTGAALGFDGNFTSPGQRGQRSRADARPPGKTGVYTPEPKIYKVDSQDFQLRPGEGVENEVSTCKRAQVWSYGWKANGKLTFEFHGEPDQKNLIKIILRAMNWDDKVGKDALLRFLHGAFDRYSRLVSGRTKAKKEVQFHLNVAGFLSTQQKCMSTVLPRTSRSKTQSRFARIGRMGGRQRVVDIY